MLETILSIIMMLFGIPIQAASVPTYSIQVYFELPIPPNYDKNGSNQAIISTNKETALPLDDNCYCVRIARKLGLNIPFVDAKDLIPNGSPDLGNGILFDYNGVRHIAVIKRFTSDGWQIEEGNFKKCQRTTRIIKWNDPFIIGFIKK